MSLSEDLLVTSSEAAAETQDSATGLKGSILLEGQAAAADPVTLGVVKIETGTRGPSTGEPLASGPFLGTSVNVPIPGEGLHDDDAPIATVKPMAQAAIGPSLAPTLAGTLGIGGFTNGTISVGGEKDVYALNVEAGHTYSISLFGNASPGALRLDDTVVTVYGDADLTSLIVSNDDYAGGSTYNSYATFTATTSGQVFIQAAGFDATKQGDYTIIAEDRTVAMPRDAIDWGTSFHDSVIKVYFAAAGEAFDGQTSLGWTQAQIDDTMLALRTMIANTGLTTIQVGTAADANMKLVTINNASAPYSAYFNPPGEAISGIGVWNLGSNSYLQAGLYANGWGPGNGAFHTLMHEFGHALGLAHTHDAGGRSNVMHGVTSSQGDYGDFDLNQGAYTLMSYNYLGDINGSAAGGTARFDNLYGFALGPSALDLGILQSRYGAKTDVATGDDTYALSNVNAAGLGFKTIWDTGGTDTIVSTSTVASVIDLRPATLLYEAGGAGWLSYVANVYAGFTIAHGVVIENATSGSGTDSLTGNDADNVLTSNGGNDTLYGGLGNDSLYAGAGTDKLYGGEGDDLLSQGDFGGLETLDGGNGHDIGDWSFDTVHAWEIDLVAGTAKVGGVTYGQLISIEGAVGGQLGDTITATDDGMKLEGAGGNDLLVGGAGTDSLFGGAGDDRLVQNDGGPREVLDGGTGSDTGDWTASTADWVIDLAAGTAIIGATVYGELTAIEGAETGSGNDLLLGDGGNNTLNGGAGDDTLNGQDGYDLLIGGEGNDLFVYDSNETFDNIYGGDGIDAATFDWTLGTIIDLGTGTYTDIAALGFGYSIISGVENITKTGLSDDTLLGSAADNALDAGEGNDQLEGALGRDTLTGGTGDDTLKGGGDDDTLYGGDGVDSLEGGAGSDLLVKGEGGAGEVMDGGDGIDTADFSATSGTTWTIDLSHDTAWLGIIAAASLSGIENVRGSASDDTILGNSGDNVLEGGTGADSLNGGSGVDTLYGGNGSDTLSQGSFGYDDVLDGGEGFDTADWSFDLNSLTVDLSLGHAIWGVAVRATLVSIEAVVGSQTFDDIAGDILSNRLDGGGGNDTLTARDGSDTLYGGAGDDILNGGKGVDVMQGGIGNDIYFVSTAADLILETAGEGTLDRVFATTSYTLAAGVDIEGLTAIKTSGVSLTGNELAQAIRGGDGSDRLVGLGGNDTLDGRTGQDRLDGGAGDDAFVVDDAADLVIEALGGGDDRLFARVDYVLDGAAEVERLILVNAPAPTALSLTGNGVSQRLFGNAGDNWLDGGAGNDTLYGGAGADHFVFSTALGAGNVDRIADFAAGTDRIALGVGVFAALAVGDLASTAFEANLTGKATDLDDRIIYQTTTGRLFYDADGSGATEGVLFAQLSGNPAGVDAGAFLVI